MDNWIKTRSGRQFSPLRPRAKDVDIYDIAHSLSQQCRFTGHTSSFYSVAEHCVRVAWYLETQKEKLHGILHDAAEAYFSDIAAPVKVTFDGIDEVEARILRAVYRGLGVRYPTPRMQAIVHHADMVLLATEGRDLMGGTKGWRPLPPPLPSKVTPMSPEEAKDTYLTMVHLYLDRPRRD